MTQLASEGPVSAASKWALEGLAASAYAARPQRVQQGTSARGWQTSPLTGQTVHALYCCNYLTLLLRHASGQTTRN